MSDNKFYPPDSEPAIRERHAFLRKAIATLEAELHMRGGTCVMNWTERVDGDSFHMTTAVPNTEQTISLDITIRPPEEAE